MHSPGIATGTVPWIRRPSERWSTIVVPVVVSSDAVNSDLDLIRSADFSVSSWKTDLDDAVRAGQAIIECRERLH